MDIYPKKISEEVINILNRDSRISLHSVFNSTFNIKIDKHIVNVNCNENILPPLGITFNEFDFKELKRNLIYDKKLKCYFYENKLYVNNIKVDFKSFEGCYSPELLKSTKPINDMNINGVIQEFFYRNCKCGFDISCIDFISGMLEDDVNSELTKLKKFFLTSNNRGFEYFIGRGKGLTPSGDDFLVGIMSIILSFENNLDKKINIIKNYLNQNRYKLTNEISESFLLNATNRKFSKNIIDFIKSLSEDKLDINKLKKILNYGQTSGVDLVLGMVFGYIMVKENKNYE